MALPTINTIGICAGVGGLELGLQLAAGCVGQSVRGVCYVEREAAAAASLVASMEAGWFHPAPVWSDLGTFDGRPWRGIVDCVTSGDPCQPNSVAGKRGGAADDRFLIDQVLRVVRECGPATVFRENVTGNAGGQLDALVPGLVGMGYRVAAGIFSSGETGNSHRRERLFVMAERLENASSGRPRHNAGEAGGRGRQRMDAGSAGLRHGDWATLPDGADTAGGALVNAKGQRPGEGGAEHAGQQGRYASASAGGAMDHPLRGRHRHEDETLRAGRDGAVDAGRSVAHARRGIAEQFEGLGARPDRKIGSGAPGQFAGSSLRLPPAIIPGPSDTRGWIDLLDSHPEYQPALSEEEAESHLRRGIDAMADRIERLRACGNGVDPVVAATAALRLRALLDQGRGTGARVAVVRAAA